MRTCRECGHPLGMRTVSWGYWTIWYFCNPSCRKLSQARHRRKRFRWLFSFP